MQFYVGPAYHHALSFLGFPCLRQGFFTCLDRDGEVYDETKYMWLNGRAVYTFSRAAVELKDEVSAEVRQAWREAARCGAEFLNKAKGPAPGCAEDVLYFSTKLGCTIHFTRVFMEASDCYNLKPCLVWVP